MLSTSPYRSLEGSLTSEVCLSTLTSFKLYFRTQALWVGMYMGSDEVNSFNQALLVPQTQALVSPHLYRYTHPGNLTPTNPPTLLWCAHLPAQNRTCTPRQGIPNLLVKHTLLQGCLFQHSGKFSLTRRPLEDCLTATEN